MLHIELKQEIYASRPVSKYSQATYTRALRWLFPTGVFWNVLMWVTSTNFWQDVISPKAESYVDDLVSEQNQDIISPDKTAKTRSRWGNLVSCFAGEIFRFQKTCEDVYNESIPGFSVALLPDWIEETGTDADVYTNYPWQSEEERALYTHYRYYLHVIQGAQGLRPAWYETYAEQLGYIITYEEDYYPSKPWVVRILITAGPAGFYELARLKHDLNLFKGSHTYFEFINNL